LIVHIHERRELDQLAVVNAAAERLIERFWPGPLTLVLPKKPVVPAIVTAGLPSVAVRMPSHPLFRRLLALTGQPLAAPSANRFGGVSPTTAEHVRQGLGRKIRHILDGGPAQIGLESTIVDLRDPRRPRLLRPGAITREQLEHVLGRRVEIRHAAGGRPSAAAKAQLAPGQLARHYSPRTPVTLHERIDPKVAARGGRTDAWLFLSRPPGLKGPAVFWLSERGNLAEAARRLFAVLRQIDGRRFGRIHAELAPGGGLAEAINDRLRRAAARDVDVAGIADEAQRRPANIRLKFASPAPPVPSGRARSGWACRR
jgi:L-threonylcarbamoyladenylate synthase